MLWANLTIKKMFNNNTSADTKIAVLEERLSAYEVMMRKIDEAIQIMGKTSQNISKMLAVHDERIEQCNRADDMIGRVLDEIREENREQHDAVSKRIDKLEKNIDELSKFKWQTLALVGAAIITVGFLVPFIDNMLSTHLNPQPALEKVK